MAKKTKQTITRKGSFDSGHRVMNEKMKCFNPHGHTYLYELCFSFNTMEDIGYNIDFKEIKRVGAQWIDDLLDHGNILNAEDDVMIEATQKIGGKMWIMSLNGFNEYDEPDGSTRLAYCNPSVENIAKEIFLAMELLFADRKGLKIESVKLHETPNCSTKCTSKSISKAERTNFYDWRGAEIIQYAKEKGVIEYDDRQEESSEVQEKPKQFEQSDRISEDAISVAEVVEVLENMKGKTSFSKYPSSEECKTLPKKLEKQFSNVVSVASSGTVGRFIWNTISKQVDNVFLPGNVWMFLETLIFPDMSVFESYINAHPSALFFVERVTKRTYDDKCSYEVRMVVLEDQVVDFAKTFESVKSIPFPTVHVVNNLGEVSMRNVVTLHTTIPEFKNKVSELWEETLWLYQISYFAKDISARYLILEKDKTCILPNEEISLPLDQFKDYPNVMIVPEDRFLWLDASKRVKCPTDMIRECQWQNTEPFCFLSISTLLQRIQDAPNDTFCISGLFVRLNKDGNVEFQANIVQIRN